jgi:hypothetical protein
VSLIARLRTDQETGLVRAPFKAWYIALDLWMTFWRLVWLSFRTFVLEPLWGPWFRVRHLHKAPWRGLEWDFERLVWRWLFYAQHPVLQIRARRIVRGSAARYGIAASAAAVIFASIASPVGMGNDGQKAYDMATRTWFGTVVGGLVANAGKPFYDPTAAVFLGGAKMDGITDDGPAYTAMYSAINTAQGGTAVIPNLNPGKASMVSGGIVVYPNTTTWFMGGATIKLITASNNDIFRPPQGANSGTWNNVVWQGRGIIDGNATNQTGGFALFNLKPGDAVNGSIDGLTIRDLSVKNAWGHQIYVAENQGGSSGSKRVENCTLDNYGVGAISYGVYFDFSPNGVVDQATFRNSNGRDACVLGHGGKYRFVHCTIYDSGVNYPFADDSTIAYNNIGTTVQGEGINNDANTANRVRIIGNWVSAAPSAQYGGIRNVGSDGFIALNYLAVTSANANTKGIMVVGSGARIADNRIEATAGAGSFAYGINCEANGKWEAHDNYVHGPTTVGIQLENDDIHVHDNKIDGPATGILYLNSATSGHANLRNNVHDNILSNNATKAIDFQNQFDPSNKCHDNPGFNPVGNVGAAPVPANGTVITNNTGVDIVVHFLNGAAACTLDMAGVAAAIVLPANAAYSFVVKHGGTYTPNFAAGAPSNKWVGL